MVYLLTKDKKKSSNSVKTSNLKDKKDNANTNKDLNTVNKNSSVTAKFKKARKKFSMPNSLTILFIVVIFATFLTWVVESGVFTPEVSEQGELGDKTFLNVGREVYGVADVFWAMGAGFVNAADLIFFLFMFGAFLQIIVSSGAMESGIGGFVKKMNGKELLLIPLLMILFAIGGTVFGLGEETPPFFIILVPILILAGFDAMTGTILILMGAGVGVLASTINPFMIGVATDTINESMGGDFNLTLGDGIGFRFVSWFILVGIAIGFVTYYAWRVKNNPEKSKLAKKDREEHDKWAKEEYNLESIPELTKRRKALLAILGLSIVLLIVLLIPWSALIPNASIPEGSPWFSREIPFFGEWWFLELGFLFFFLTIIVGLVAGLNEKQIISEMHIGSKDMIGVAMIIAMARGVAIILGGTELETAIVFTDVDGAPAMTIEAIGNSEEWDKYYNDIFIDYGASEINTLLTAFLDPDSGYIVFVSAVDNGGVITTTYTVNLVDDASVSNTILNGMAGGASAMAPEAFLPVIYFIQIPMSFLIPSTSGLSGVSMPIIGPWAVAIAGESASLASQHISAAGAITATSFASGLVNLITPSSAILMVGLSLGRVQYGTYIKTVWPLLLMLFVASTLLLVINGSMV